MRCLKYLSLRDTPANAARCRLARHMPQPPMAAPRESAPDKNDPNRNHSGQKETDICRHLSSPRGAARRSKSVKSSRRLQSISHEKSNATPHPLTRRPRPASRVRGVLVGPQPSSLGGHAAHESPVGPVQGPPPSAVAAALWGAPVAGRDAAEPAVVASPLPVRDRSKFRRHGFEARRLKVTPKATSAPPSFAPAN
jgi:hypothetical protein